MQKQYKAKLYYGNRFIKELYAPEPVKPTITTFIDKTGKRKIGNDIVIFEVESRQGVEVVYRAQAESN